MFVPSRKQNYRNQLFIIVITDLDADVDAALAVTRERVNTIHVQVLANQGNVRKNIAMKLIELGFVHGRIQRKSDHEVEVVVVMAETSGPTSEERDRLVNLARYFGSRFGVTKGQFIRGASSESVLTRLLNQPLLIIKTGVPDPDNKSDENYDLWSGDGDGISIRSVSELDGVLDS